MDTKEFLYENVYTTIKNRIDNGSYSSGSKLSTEAQLKDEFGVSVITVKKALSMLAEEGLIKRVPGKGTFVSKSSVANRKSNKFIGLILEHVTSAFGLEMMYEIEKLANKAGYKTFIRFSYGSRERETEEIDFLMSLGVVGLIIMPSHGVHYNPSILKLVLDDFPVVLVDKKLKGIDVPSVRTDNSRAANQLVHYLHKKGCRRIGLVSPDEKGATSLEERRSGFKKAMTELRLPIQNECKIINEIFFEESMPNKTVAQSIIDYLKVEAGNLDGVVLTEYGLVREFVAACKYLKIVPDRDIMVCCIDEDYLSAYGFTFTHMKQDEFAIARKAVEFLQMKLQHREIEQSDCKIEALFNEAK